MAADGERKKQGRVNQTSQGARFELKELGITYTQSSRWQQIARVPEETVAQYIAECIKKKQGRTDLTVQRDGQLEIPKQTAFFITPIKIAPGVQGRDTSRGQ